MEQRDLAVEVEVPLALVVVEEEGHVDVEEELAEVEVVVDREISVAGETSKDHPHLKIRLPVAVGLEEPLEA